MNLMNQPHLIVASNEEQTVYHLSAEIDYLMGLPNTKLQRMFKDEEGNRPEAREIREMLEYLKADGVKCIPVEQEQCDRWDNKMGCLGHLKVVASV